MILWNLLCVVRCGYGFIESHCEQWQFSHGISTGYDNIDTMQTRYMAMLQDAKRKLNLSALKLELLSSCASTARNGSIAMIINVIREIIILGIFWLVFFLNIVRFLWPFDPDVFSSCPLIFHWPNPVFL